ncbi:hypothetical protein KY331_05125 [Candidatus Woesearchaeota archaeon]|nr:hypothetical protein [Candidatus Woesearchaeota archaeon]
MTSKMKKLKDFKDSFKPKITWIYIMLFDLLFFAVAILTLKGVGSFLEKKMAVINMPEGDLLSMTQEQLQPITAQLQDLVISIGISVILVFIVMIAIWSLSKGLIYCTILKKKFTKQYFKKFFLLNLFLSIVIIIILTFLMTVGSVLKELVAFRHIFYIFLLAVAYYLSINYIFFTKHNKVFESIGKTLTFGTKNILKLLIPCLLIYIPFQIIFTTLTLIPIPLFFAPFVSLIIFVIFMAWARNYFVQEVNKIKS